MSRTPEAIVKSKVRDILKKHSLYFFTPVGGGFGKSGVPDIIACCNGRFIGIECKAGGNKPSSLQSLHLAMIVANNGVALVINETNTEDVEECITFILTQPSASGYGNFVMPKAT